MGDNGIDVEQPHHPDSRAASQEGPPRDDLGTANRLAAAAQGAVREGQESDRVDGVQPRWVVTPADTDQVSAVMTVCHEAGLAVVARGLGTKLGWGAPPRRLDVVLETTRLDRLVEHASGDLVAVVGAGRLVASLQDDLARSGQWLAVDPARHGTVGGLVATADSGPVRLSYGPVRDLVIGMTLVRPDGVVAHSGGRVVKNVAGYDLGKLLTGSFGTLGVITEVAFRLHPRPESTQVVAVPVRSPQHAGELVQKVVQSQLVATACELDVPPGGGATLAVRFDGIAAGARARAAAALELLRTGAEAVELPMWWGRQPGDQGAVRLKVTHEIASVATVLESIDRVCGAHGILAAVRGSVAVGTLQVALPADVNAAAVVRVVDELRAQAPRFGGAVVVRDADPVTRRHLDVWGPVGGLELMRRVKEQFDPTGILAPGRFVGGI